MELSNYCRHEGCKKLRTKFSVFCDKHHRQQLMLPEWKYTPVKREMEFCCGGGKAGYFEEKQYPLKDGIYRYEPYRSMHHFRMCQLVREKGSAQCSIEIDGVKSYFDAVGIPAHGLLELKAFRPSRGTAGDDDSDQKRE